MGPAPEVNPESGLDYLPISLGGKPHTHTHTKDFYATDWVKGLLSCKTGGYKARQPHSNSVEIYAGTLVWIQLIRLETLGS